MSGDNKGEDAAGETLEEAGALEADVGANFDQQLAGIDPRLQINMDPFAHRDLRPEMMFIREELRQAKWQTLAGHGRNISPATPAGFGPLEGGPVILLTLFEAHVEHNAPSIRAASMVGQAASCTLLAARMHGVVSSK